MEDLILYLCMAAIGYVIGVFMRKQREKLWWTGKVQMFSITLLVVAMGSRMGANDEVIKNLHSIGFYALIITIFVLVFSVGGIFFTRKLMGIDRYGRLFNKNIKEEGTAKKEEVMNGSQEKASKKIDTMTVIIVVAVFVGMGIGYFVVNKVFDDFETFNNAAGMGIKIGLCILLAFVGLDLGLDESVKDNFRKVGFRVIAFPIVTGISTLAGATVCSLFLPINVKEALCIGAGYGWYSLAPGIILEHGMVTVSAISFMHNVLRELLAILFIPTVAKKIGFIETTSMPGAAAMDVCLPIIEKSTGSTIAIYSFISGLVLSLAVPFVVPIFISL